jgi:sirohydrochlorin cobaltochelatase
MTHGVLLIAHGARDPRWALPFEDVAARIRAGRPGACVQLAYLELMRPSIAEAGAALAAAGCSEVDVLPLFLGAGGHVRKDLPRFVAELGAAHAGVAWRLQPAIGETERVVAAMAAAAIDLLGAAPAGMTPAATAAPAVE